MKPHALQNCRVRIHPRVFLSSLDWGCAAVYTSIAETSTSQSSIHILKIGDEPSSHSGGAVGRGEAFRGPGPTAGCVARRSLLFAMEGKAALPASSRLNPQAACFVPSCLRSVDAQCSAPASWDDVPREVGACMAYGHVDEHRRAHAGTTHSSDDLLHSCSILITIATLQSGVAAHVPPNLHASNAAARMQL